ncbi:transketolase-like TK C-terminal-containing protein, partial [Pseudomonas sp. P5_A2_2]
AYRLEGDSHAQVQLLGSGAILGEVQAARQLLADDWGIQAAVWSVTSYTELHREAIALERTERFGGEPKTPYITRMLDQTQGPVIAATDYVRALPELIRGFVPSRYVTLGTDGFGRSDTRQALREFFEVDRHSIVIAALKSLVDEESLDSTIWRQALSRYRSEGSPSIAPWQC